MVTRLPDLSPTDATQGGRRDFQFTVPQAPSQPQPLPGPRDEAYWQGITAGWLAGAAEAVG